MLSAPDERVALRRRRPRAAGSTILLVDDDAAVRLALSRVLEMEGWKVVTAETGEAALEQLQEHEPDLMITDLRMAAVSGWDLLFHESIQRPRMPIFVITALPVQLVAGADKFATAFFPKPLDLDGLIDAVHRHVKPREASDPGE